MSYRIERAEDVLAGVQRIAGEQLEKTRSELNDDQSDIHEKVHQTRKRFKKIRGLIRFARPMFPKTYQSENQWYRDQARRISEVRDCTGRLETFEAICERFVTILKAEQLAPVASKLFDERDRLAHKMDLDSVMEDILKELENAKARVKTWSIEKSSKNWSDGLAKTYDRARECLSATRKKSTDKRFHQWRKRVKYHKYHCRLLRNVWPPVIKSRIGEVDALASLLGDDHDLAVFTRFIESSDFEDLDEIAMEGLHAVIIEDRERFQHEALQLGSKLFCESTSCFTSRMRDYWTTWKQESDS